MDCLTEFLIEDELDIKLSTLVVLRRIGACPSGGGFAPPSMPEDERMLDVCEMIAFTSSRLLGA